MATQTQILANKLSHKNIRANGSRGAWRERNKSCIQIQTKVLLANGSQDAAVTFIFRP